MTGKRRRSYEAGHRAKFLVVVDDTPECDRAIYFASRRAARTGVSVIMVCVVPPADFQHWLGVGDVMRAEAEEEANERLEQAAARVRQIAGIEPERVVRFGTKAEEILSLIEEDEDIALLVLAAGTGSEGPGPLVSMLASRAAATFPVPVAIVPGHLADEEIDALA
ncbi:universal stress protein [Chelatococcus sp. SYSU_G07232]|uniref:Universal stress protein n=1 Tax=Chelatococcus albus TaxID=3047466 RepID=A0ABT7AJH7_9HYPH|nr:universal stress protein [Chelatococcus sp. SYSU_G07232]MDJ1158741.1 universal stress protein [Chelatococcus sp. SYSU_G07232]